VIGAVAWALLGPKELFRLSRQAGEFLGEWQSLGAQARDTFKQAMEAEMAEAEAEAKPSPFPKPPKDLDALFNPEEAAPAAPPASNGASAAAPKKVVRETMPVVPSLADYAAAKGASEAGAAAESDLSDAEREQLFEDALSELGDPESNRANFQEQLSGERNAAVMAEYPAELSYEEWSADKLRPDEDLLDTQIQEAENQLALLRAEQKVLALRRKQQETNAERAQKWEDEQALASSDASG